MTTGLCSEDIQILFNYKTRFVLLKVIHLKAVVHHPASDLPYLLQLKPSASFTEEVFYYHT